MNKLSFYRGALLAQAGLLEFTYCIFGLNCDFSQSAKPFLRFRYV